jgi:hypothetical protein
LVQNLIALKFKQKVLIFRKIYTPKFLGCYMCILLFFLINVGISGSSRRTWWLLLTLKYKDNRYYKLIFPIVCVASQLLHRHKINLDPKSSIFYNLNSTKFHIYIYIYIYMQISIISVVIENTGNRNCKPFDASH